MAEVDFNPAELKALKRIGVKYEDSDGKSRTIDANITFLSDNNLTLSFSGNKDFNPDCPHSVSLTYAINNALCIADTTLNSIRRANGLTFLIIQYPQKVMQINRRRYYRIRLKRTCVLVCTDEYGNSESFVTRLVDISLGGLLFHKLESMYSDDYVKIEPSKYKYFHMVLFLDIDVVVKLSARYVRQEKGRVSYRYAFEFLEMKKSTAEKLSKYLTKEQIRQHKLQEQAKKV